MNDQTPLRLDAACGPAPASLQDAAMLFRRRAIMAGLVLRNACRARLRAAPSCSAEMAGAALDIGIFVTFLIATPWTVIGFWNAVIGFWLLHGASDPLAKVSPFLAPPPRPGPLTLRTAILMTLRNEDPARAFSRLRIIRDSLEATGQGAPFRLLYAQRHLAPPYCRRRRAAFRRLAGRIRRCQPRGLPPPRAPMTASRPAICAISCVTSGVLPTISCCRSMPTA